MQNCDCCCPRKYYGKYTIDIEGNKTVLTLTKEEKDLGVKFDEGLNFATHISEVITKGIKELGLSGVPSLL